MKNYLKEIDGLNKDDIDFLLRFKEIDKNNLYKRDFLVRKIKQMKNQKKPRNLKVGKTIDKMIKKYFKDF